MYNGSATEAAISLNPSRSYQESLRAQLSPREADTPQSALTITPAFLLSATSS